MGHHLDEFFRINGWRSSQPSQPMENSKTSLIRRQLDDGDTPEQAHCHSIPRWLVVSSVNADNNLSKLNCFIIGKAFKCQVGSLKTVRPLQRGDILVETTSKTQSDRVLYLKELAGVPVVVTPHRSLNTSKGVIRCRDIVLCEALRERRNCRGAKTSRHD